MSASAYLCMCRHLPRAATAGPCRQSSRQALTEVKAVLVRVAQLGVVRMVPFRKTYLLVRQEGRREKRAREEG